MRLFRPQSAGLAVLLAALAFALPVHAQTPAAAAAPTISPAPQQAENPNGDWDSANADRQQFREEMERIRKQHDDLQNASDALLDKCLNASGDKAAECEKEKQDIVQRRTKLRARVHALHEKMEAARKARMARMKQRIEDRMNKTMSGSGMGPARIEAPAP
ncbi:MAG: hypothetical protein KGI97_07405, partial [Alphaproteobacteria bacterium]|nr:hypothetical protein [Alphaproteobacteria bacterium]